MRSVSYGRFKTMVLKAVYAWMESPFDEGSRPDGYALELNDKLLLQDYGGGVIEQIPPSNVCVVTEVTMPDGEPMQSAVWHYFFFADADESWRANDEISRNFHEHCLIDHQFIDVSQMPEITGPVNLEDYLPETVAQLEKYESIYDAQGMDYPHLAPFQTRPPLKPASDS